MSGKYPYPCNENMTKHQIGKKSKNPPKIVSQTLMDQNTLGHGIILTKLILKEMTNPQHIQKIIHEDFNKNDGVKHGK